MKITVKLTTDKLHEISGATCLSATSRGQNSILTYRVPGISKIHISEFPNISTGGVVKYVYYPDNWRGPRPV